MSKILIENKQIVTPGEQLAEGMDFLPVGGAFREGEKIIASQLGLISVNERIIKVIPLSGKYVPKTGDIVIGQVSEVGYNNWFVNVGYAYEANLSLKDATSDFIERGSELSRYYDIGEYIVTKITNVTKSKAIDLTMKGPGLRKLYGGIIIEVTAQKIPRIVGKLGSMINLIKTMTGCQITAGQNGRIWIKGETPEQEKKAIEAIRLVETKAHTSGLTDKIKKFLTQKINK